MRAPRRSWAPRLRKSPGLFRRARTELEAELGRALQQGEIIIGARDAAKLLGVSPNSLRLSWWRSRHQIPCRYLGRRLLFVRVELLRWALALPRKAPRGRPNAWGQLPWHAKAAEGRRHKPWRGYPARPAADPAAAVDAGRSPASRVLVSNVTGLFYCSRCAPPGEPARGYDPRVDPALTFMACESCGRPLG